MESSTSQNVLVQKAGSPLAAALMQMDAIFAAIDSGEIDDEEYARQLLQYVGGEISNSVDRRLGSLKSLTGGSFVLGDKTTGYLGTAYAELARARHRVKVLEKSVERLKQNTIEVLKNADKDAVAGTYGGFKLVENPPALEITIPGYKTKSQSISNVIDPADMELYSLPAKYLIQTLTHSINCEKIKGDMLAGEKGWAWARIVKRTNIKTI